MARYPPHSDSRQNLSDAAFGEMSDSRYGRHIAAPDCEMSIEQKPPPRAPKVLTVGEVATYLHVHPSTIYRLLRQGRLPAFRIGSDWRFSLENIDHWRLRGGVPPNTRG